MVAPQASLARIPASAGGVYSGGFQVGNFLGSVGSAIGPIGFALLGISLVGMLLGGAKAKKRLKESRVVEFSDLGTAGSPLGFAFGRCVVPGTPVYPAAWQDIPYIGTVGTDNVKKIFGTLGLKDDKARNKSLLLQSALSIGEIDDIVAVFINDKILGGAPVSSGIERFKSNVARVELNQYETPSITAKNFTGGAIGGRRGNSSMERTDDTIFKGMTYTTALHFLTTDKDEEVLYSGSNVPQHEYHLRGMKVRSVLADGTFGPREWSNNKAFVLLEYLTNIHSGPLHDGDLTEDVIDLDSFYKYSQICAFRTKSSDTDIDDISDDELTRLGITGDLTPTQRAAVVAAIRGGLSIPGFSSLGRLTNLTEGIQNKGFFPSALNLKKQETNDRLLSDEDRESALSLLLISDPSAGLYTDEETGKLAVSGADSETPEADQSVGDVTKNHIISEGITVLHPSVSGGLVNQLTVRFRNVSKYNEEDTITFPPKGSTWHNQLVEEDGGTISEEVSPFGIDNEYAAKSYAATYILMQRRSLYIWEEGPWGIARKHGQVLRINLDDKQKIIAYSRIEAIGQLEHGTSIRYKLVARHFIRTDYKFQIDVDEPILNLNAFNTTELRPLTGISATVDGSDVTVSLVDDNPDAQTVGFDIQVKSTEPGSEWDQWTTITNPEILDHTDPTKDGTFIFRARKYDSYRRTGDWIEMDAADAVTVIASSRPALTVYILTAGDGTVPDKPQGGELTETSFMSTNGYEWPRPSYDPLRQQLWESSLLRAPTGSIPDNGWSTPRLSSPVLVTRMFYKRSVVRPDLPNPVLASQT